MSNPLKLIKNPLHWFLLMLSDSHIVSVKRAIGLAAFICFVTQWMVALFGPELHNQELLKQYTDYLFAIIMVCVAGVTLVDVAMVFKGRYSSLASSYGYGSDDMVTQTTTIGETGGE